MTLLLGLDEGTSAVKAILFDQDLQPLREARREKALSHPRPGWVEQDPEEVLDAVAAAVAELLGDAPDEEIVCRARPSGRVRCSRGMRRAAGPLTPIVTWQDSGPRRFSIAWRPRAAAGRSASAAACRSTPYFSAGKLTWLLEHDDALARAVEAGRARLGTVDAFLCDRLGAGFHTDPSTASRTQLGAPRWDPELLAIFGVPEAALPPIVDTVGGDRHAAPRVVAARAAAVRALRRPAGRAGRRRLCGARPHEGRPTAPACSCSRTSAANGPRRPGGCCRRSPGAIAERWSGRSTAACSRPARCSNG